MILMALDSSTVETDSENWYIDNGDTSHVTNKSDFTGTHTVTTANGTAVHAIGKENLEIVADVRGIKELITLNDVWYVLFIKKNLFSVLSAQDRLQNTVFESQTKMYVKKFEGGRIY